MVSIHYRWPPTSSFLLFEKCASTPAPYSAPCLSANMAWVVPGLASPRGGKKQLVKLEDVKEVLSSQPLSLRIALLPWFSKGASVYQHECAHEARGARGHR